MKVALRVYICRRTSHKIQVGVRVQMEKNQVFVARFSVPDKCNV